MGVITLLREGAWLFDHLHGCSLPYRNALDERLAPAHSVVEREQNVEHWIGGSGYCELVEERELSASKVRSSQVRSLLVRSMLVHSLWMRSLRVCSLPSIPLRNYMPLMQRIGPAGMLKI